MANPSKMRRVCWLILIALCLIFAGPVWSGTGGGEEPGAKVRDDDFALRAAVRWILGIKGLKVIQSERTVDLNEYRIDHRGVGAGVMKTISDGLINRKWKVRPRQDAKASILEATKDNQSLKVSLAKAGKEPRLTVEIRKTK